MDVTSLPQDVASLTIEHGGQQIPIHEHAAIKGTADMPTLFKRFVEQDAEINRRVRMPAADKPEDVKGFWSRVGESKIPVDPEFMRGAHGVPADAKDYEYAKPENLPEGMTWSDEKLAAAKTWAHKTGLNKEQFKSAVDLYNTMQAEQLNVFRGDPQASMAKLKEQWGADFDGRWALANIGAEKFFGGDKDLMDVAKSSGLAFLPSFAERMAEYAAATTEDRQLAGGASGGSTVQQEYEAITKPGSPSFNEAKFKLWQGGDVETIKQVQELSNKLRPGIVRID